MAGPKTPSGDATEHIAERVVDIDVEREMQAAFLEYAYSVIYSRALPDARDGLKPVQRRILYTMAEMGLRPDRAHVKSGRIVGDVMGKLHPHGDGAIYDALVRLAQDFTMRLPLVDGHGNFGSLDDGPAAYRYCVTGDTRVRLADGTSPRIADLADLAPDSERPLDVEVIDRAGQPVRASKIFHSGSHPIVSVQTETGHQLRGSRNHPVLALALVDRVPRLVWRRLDQLHPGDVLCLARNAPLRAPRVSVPDRHLGVLAGAWASQGWASRERAAFTTTDPVYFDLVVTAYRDLVGGRTFVDRRPVHRSGATTYMLDVHDTTALARSAIGELVGLRAKDVRIPDAVWRAGAGAKRSFLQAAFEGDGSIVRTRLRTVSLEYRTYSRSLAHDVQELLLEFGVVAHLTQDVARDEYRLIVAGRANVDLFVAEVGFLSGKRERLTQALAELPEDAHRLGGDLAPFLGEYLLRSMPHQRLDGEEHPGDDGWAGPPDDDPSAEPPDDLADPLPAGPWGGSGEATGPRRRATDTLPLVTARSGPVRSVVAAIMEPGFRYVAVASVEHLGPEPVYSVKVDSDDHSYLAGGFVNHNTEARMAPAAMLMTDGLDEDVVDFVPNYDGQLTQPDVMPSTLPNLLVNGASGIAVGMATNMPPHNLVEVVGAARHLIAHPDATLEDLMRFVPGPDLPTGGRIVGLDGIRDAYAGGRGTFRTRATTRIESVTARRQGIVVTELPYLVGPEKVIEKIKTLVQAGKLKGIADVADLTDREKGLRLVIELKGGFNAEAVLEQLFRMTPLEDSFGINNVALVEGQPRTLGLRELLEVFIGHRLEVVRRRCTYRLGKAGDRLHLVEGLLIAILDIDEVIAVIRGSDDTAQARERLMTVFDLTRVQADYILEMPLRRLTKYSTIELETERTELQATMAELEAILASEARRREVVSTELAEVATTYGTPRRTVLLESAGVAVTASRATPLEVTDDPCRVLLSSTGLLARTAGDEPLTPPDPARRASHDVVVSAVRATARGEVAAVTNHGRMIRLSVVDMPALPPTSSAPSLAGGARIEEFLALGKGERVLCLSTLAEDSPGLALGTAQGVVKRVATDYPANKESWEMIALRDGDEVVGAVELPSERCDLVFISSDAQLLRFDAERVRPQGRAAGGMAGIALSAGARAVFFGAVDLTLDDGEWASAVVTVAGDSGGLPGTQAGTAKVTPFAEYPAKGRATGGVRCQRFLKGEDTLLLAWAGTAPPIAAAGSGVAVPLPPVDSRRDGSGTPLRQPISAVAGPPR